MIDLELAHVRGRLAERGFELELDEGAKEFLIRVACKDLDYGARPLRRAIEHRVEDPLSEELLKGEFQGKTKIMVTAVHDDEGRVRRLDFKGLEIVEEQPEPVAATDQSDDTVGDAVKPE